MVDPPSLPPNACGAQITADPLADLPIGSTLVTEPIVFGGANATRLAQGTTNWTFFEGAMLAVLIGDGSQNVHIGTAVLIAPGLAVSAMHILDDHLEGTLAGRLGLICFGPRSGGKADVWRVRHISTAPDSDIAYLSLVLASAITPDWQCRTMPVTTRAPAAGEIVSFVGFVLDPRPPEAPNRFAVEGNLFCSAGEVNNVFHPMRDKLLLPYPAIEVACGTLGRMSGGALLDSRGYLLGVIARGYDVEDGEGPSYGAWIVGALNRTIQVPWPPGAYGESIHVLKIPTMVLEGRDRVTVHDENRYTYQVWFDRDEDEPPTT